MTGLRLVLWRIWHKLEGCDWPTNKLTERCRKCGKVLGDAVYFGE